MPTSNNRRLAPHRNAYVRLQPPKLHGVGVFAIRPIKKGTNPFKDDNSTMIWIPEANVRRLPKNIRKFYLDFGVLKTDMGRTSELQPTDAGLVF